MATRLMTPFCIASVLFASLVADGAIASSFRTTQATNTGREDAPGEMGGVAVGTFGAALGICADEWEAA